MNAVVFERFGPPEVLHLQRVAKPIPAANEVLIKARAASVTKYDTWERSRTAPPGFNFILKLTAGSKPKKPILGTEVAGVVDAVGSEVDRFEIGDAVFAYSGINLGGCAEYVRYSQDSVAHKPANISFEEAAGALQGGLTALYFLRKAAIEPGQRVLIVGASGGVGSCAVQLAKHHFMAEVTGVCSGSKADFVRSLGADHVIDYRQQDFTEGELEYDVIFDTMGKSSISRSLRRLKAGGSYLFATFGLSILIQMLWQRWFRGRRMIFGLLKEQPQDFELLRQLLADGVIQAPVDKTFPIDQAAAAHRYVESGQKMGSVILTF